MHNVGPDCRYNFLQYVYGGEGTRGSYVVEIPLSYLSLSLYTYIYISTFQRALEVRDCTVFNQYKTLH